MQAKCENNNVQLKDVKSKIEVILRFILLVQDLSLSFLQRVV